MMMTDEKPPLPPPLPRDIGLPETLQPRGPLSRLFGRLLRVGLKTRSLDDRPR